MAAAAVKPDEILEPVHLVETSLQGNLQGALDAMAETARHELERAKFIARNRPLTFEETQKAVAWTGAVVRTLREVRESKLGDELIDKLRGLSNDELRAWIDTRWKQLTAKGSK